MSCSIGNVRASTLGWKSCGTEGHSLKPRLGSSLVGSEPKKDPGPKGPRIKEWDLNLNLNFNGIKGVWFVGCLVSWFPIPWWLMG